MEFAREEFITVLGIESQRARVLQYFIIHGGRSQVWGNTSFWGIGERGTTIVSRHWSAACHYCYKLSIFDHYMLGSSGVKRRSPRKYFGPTQGCLGQKTYLTRPLKVGIRVGADTKCQTRRFQLMTFLRQWSKVVRQVATSVTICQVRRSPLTQWSKIDTRRYVEHYDMLGCYRRSPDIRSTIPFGKEPNISESEVARRKERNLPSFQIVVENRHSGRQ